MAPIGTLETEARGVGLDGRKAVRSGARRRSRARMATGDGRSSPHVTSVKLCRIQSSGSHTKSTWHGWGGGGSG